MHSARHLIRCRLTQQTRGYNAFDDAAITIHQSLIGGSLLGVGDGSGYGVAMARGGGGGGGEYRQGLTNNARNDMLFHLPQETRVYNVDANFAGMICQALSTGGPRLSERVRTRSPWQRPAAAAGSCRAQTRAPPAPPPAAAVGASSRTRRIGVAVQVDP